jgi:parallel beta-helix repeat protein
MVDESRLKKGIVVGIIFLCIGASVVSGFDTNSTNNHKSMNRGNWLYVGGSGPGNYTTIQSAIDTAQPGDTIYVFNGTYYENVNINTDGIDLLGEDKNTTIIDAHDAGDGIFISIHSHNLIISNFTIRNANGSGIIFGNPTQGAILQNNTISNCIIYNSSANYDPNFNKGFGIVFGGHDPQMNDNSIINCEVYNNDRSGIIIFRGAYDQIRNNRIIDCKSYNNGFQSGGDYTKGGIVITSHYNRYIENTIIQGCEVYNNAGDGIFSMDFASGTTITNNTLHNNGWYGINVSGTNHNDLIYHNNLIDNGQNAYDTSSNLWWNITIQEGNYWSDYTGTDVNGDGIGDTPYNIPGDSNQDLYPFMYPNGWIPPSYVWVDDDYNSSTPGWGYDHFSSIQTGIDAVDVSGTVFVYSGTYTEELGPNSEYVRIEKSLNIVGENRETTIINCPVGETGVWIKPGLSEVKILGFTVIGNHQESIGIYGINNNNDIIVENCIVNSFYDGISLVSNTNSQVRNCTTFDNSRDGGIDITGGSNNLIDNCNSYSNSCGIAIQNCNHVTVSNCSCSNNNDDGIYLTDANYITVSYCICLNNTADGISPSYSSNNIISDNICNNNRWGILPYQSNNNKIYNNSVTSNLQQGIYPWESSGNIIYHNNLINNLNQNANDDGTNTWYNATLLEGNYWSDYTGEDNNGDGIGDTPYNISGGSNQDLYPFMKPSDWLNEPPIANFIYTINELFVNFSASSSYDSDGYISAWIWDFDDGAGGAGERVAHIYLLSGTYNVTLTVVDDDGVEDSITEEIIVEKEPEFQIAFIFGKITNLSTQGDYITFEVVKTRVITFAPFSFITYASGEEFIILKEHLGFINIQYVLAFCKILL